MKKFLSLILLLFGLFFQTEVFAEQFSPITFKQYSSENAKPNGIEISREYIPLESSMKKDYIIVGYTIKNKSFETASVKIINSGYSPQESLVDFWSTKKAKQSKTSFISSFKEGIIMLQEMSGHPLGIIHAPVVAVYFAGKIPFEFLRSTYNVFASPYYSIKNKEDKKLLKKDLQTLNIAKDKDNDKEYILEHNYALKFYGIFKINNENPEIKITYPNGKSYCFEI